MGKFLGLRKSRTCRVIDQADGLGSRQARNGCLELVDLLLEDVLKVLAILSPEQSLELGPDFSGCTSDGGRVASPEPLDFGVLGRL